MCRLLGGGTTGEVVEKFKERFKEKTGLDWDNRHARPIPKKYTFANDDYYHGCENSSDPSDALLQ
jgi:hypothetical protein